MSVVSVARGNLFYWDEAVEIVERTLWLLPADFLASDSKRAVPFLYPGREGEHSHSNAPSTPEECRLNG